MNTRSSSLRIHIEWLADVAHRAGRAILDIYESGQQTAVEIKSDNSPLTEADRRSNAIILDALASAYPDVPVISEESAHTPYEVRKDWSVFWLVDPLDGTKEFLKRNGEFTVNIALIQDGAPAAGIVHQPVAGLSYWTLGDGTSYLRRQDGTDVPLRRGPDYTTLSHVRVIGSRSHESSEASDFVEQLKARGHTVEYTPAGSSLKLCLVAEGRADVYPRFSPTMEWDTAAAHAVAANAGCQVLALPDLTPLRYNKPSLLNPHFLVR